jgi:hypothetical protein
MRRMTESTVMSMTHDQVAAWTLKKEMTMVSK